MKRWGLWIGIILLVVAAATNARAASFSQERADYRASFVAGENGTDLVLYGTLDAGVIADFPQITVDDLPDSTDLSGVDLEGKRLLIWLTTSMHVSPYIDPISTDAPFVHTTCEELTAFDGAIRCTVDFDAYRGDPVFGEFAASDPAEAREAFIAFDETNSRVKMGYSIRSSNGAASPTTKMSDLLTAGVDADADSVPDDFDNCPNTENVDQADADANGVGDACEEPAENNANGDGTIEGNGEGNTASNLPTELGFDGGGACALLPDAAQPPLAGLALLFGLAALAGWRVRRP